MEVDGSVRTIRSELRAMKAEQQRAASDMPGHALEIDVTIPTYSFASAKPSHTGQRTVWLRCNTSTIMASPYFTSGPITNIYWQPVHKEGYVGWTIANYNDSQVTLHLKIVANQVGDLSVE